MTTSSLLVVGHAPSANATQICEAIIHGARSEELAVNCEWRSPFNVDHKDVLKADAIVLFTTENFGYMNGALKDFFERIYYPCLDNPKQNEGKPYALVVKAGNDGSGATRSVQTIVTGLKWREVAEPLLCKGELTTKFIPDCQNLGLTLAASLDAQLY